MADSMQLRGDKKTKLADGLGGKALGYELEAPGLIGEIRFVEQPAEGDRDVMRGSTLGVPAMASLKSASEKHEITIKTFELDIQEGSAKKAKGTRAPGSPVTAHDEDAILFRTPATKENSCSVVMYTDESGFSRWILPKDFIEKGPTRGAGSSFVFALPRENAAVPTPESDAATLLKRGKLTKLGRRIVRVLTWVTDPLVGMAANKIAGKWEDTNRPYSLHSFPFSSASVEPDLTTFDQGRALLFIHGTFSTSIGGFGSIGDATASEIKNRYGGRIVGFNHPTLHVSPKDNAQMLLDMLSKKLKPGTTLDFDVVTHSRGGLVARWLLEGLAQLNTHGLNLKFRRAVLVASPNLGTALADGDHGIDFLDRYTALLTNLPDNAFTFMMEGLLAIVKIVYHGAVKELSGLQSMNPGGDFLKSLNGFNLGEIKYFAIAANYEPPRGLSFATIGAWVGDNFVDSCFQENNDMVVPTTGAYERVAKQEDWIGAESRVVFDKKSVHHLNYFEQPETRAKLLEWLTA